MNLLFKKGCLIALLLFSQVLLAQLKTYSFEEIDSLSIQKPIVVFLHTNWCKHCKTMQKETFTNKAVIKELNNNYFYIPLDAEYKETILFNEKKYHYATNPRKGKVHELAEELGSHLNRIKYPSIIVLNRKKEVVHTYRSRLKPKGLLRLLNDIKLNEAL